MPALVQAMHDDIYYFSHVIIKAEDTLFCVPRHELERNSPVFRDMFSLPTSTQAKEGKSDETPIVLERVGKDEFRQLLRVMLCREDIGGPEDTLPTTFKEWTSAIKLAHRWEMDKVYRLAIKHASNLKDIDPVEKAAVAFTYDIPDWIESTVNDIARRDEPVSRRDVDILGLDIALKIAEVREHINGRGLVGKRDAKHLDFRPEIQKVFGSRFADFADFIGLPDWFSEDSR